MSVNKQILKGHLGSDIRVHTFEGGDKVSQFTLATNSYYTNKQTGEKVETTEWHNIRLRNGLTLIFEKHVKKGDEVYLEGTTKSRKYTDNEGVERYVKEVHVDTFDFCSNKRTSESTTLPVAPAADKQQDHDDLPF